MTRRSSTCIFGPVPSRRLGRSLGVDLVPLKTCTYDCIYCQLGRTTTKTIERREYVPTRTVIADLRRKLEEDVRADYVTFSGSGEPTLHCAIGEIIAAAKSMTDVPVAVLTNGSLLWDPDVQAALSRADVVVPSLDAGDADLFAYVNRPHHGIAFDRMVEGLVTFRERYRKPVWLEVMLLGGVTSVELEVRRIAKWVQRIAPDRVQLNTATRPPAEDYALPVPKEVLERLAALFDPPAEVVASIEGGPGPFEHAISAEEVIALLARRPCTVQDVACGLDVHHGEVAKLLDAFVSAGKVIRVFQAGQYFFMPADRE